MSGRDHLQPQQFPHNDRRQKRTAARAKYEGMVPKVTEDEDPETMPLRGDHRNQWSKKVIKGEAKRLGMSYSGLIGQVRASGAATLPEAKGGSRSQAAIKGRIDLANMITNEPDEWRRIVQGGGQ